MYKRYKKNGYNIMAYYFDSIIEFLDFLDNNPTKKDASNILASENGTYQFCKTKSYEEAKNLCKYGYHENFNKLIELKNQLERYIQSSKVKMQQTNSYVGYVPDVKTYLEGSPLSMFNKEIPQKKHFSIYYNAAYSSETSIEQIYNNGAIALCLVEILEYMGFSVDLNVFSMCLFDKNIHYAIFNLKRRGERLNIQKLYFPLCHPSFLRRLIFRLEEETIALPLKWFQVCYAYPCSESLVRKIQDLKNNDIVICQPNEMGVFGKDIIEDADNMFNHINSTGEKDFKLPKVKKI